MDAGDIISIGRQTVWIIIKTSVPILLDVNDCRSDHQSFADIDVNTGTDTYIRPETAGNYACTDDYGTVAAE